MIQLFQLAERVARFDKPVLIRGERGTGKELLARYIHDQSTRLAHPYEIVNCGSLQKQLANSTLFGHEKGSFTGAEHKRIGKFEKADLGSLFLDEIGNMDLDVQDKILRAIEYQSFERVGGQQKLNCDVRLISATNANLEELTGEGLFKADLLDRISHTTLRIPPLRERREDIPNLILHFIQEMHQDIPNLEERKFAPKVFKTLQEYHWPGNIRELKNTIERLYLYSINSVIQMDELPVALHGQKVEGEGFHGKVESFQRSLLMESLEASGHNQKAAADKLNMSYDQFRHYFKKLINTV